MSAWRCRRYQPLLVDCVDGVLDAAQQRTLDGHLGACAHCRRDLAALREIPDALQSASIPEPAEEFWRYQRQAIGRAIRNLPAPRATARTDWRAALRMPAWRVPVAVAASLLVALAVYRSAEHAQAPQPQRGLPVATLDPDAVGVLDEMMQAVTPRDDFIPQPVADDDTVAAEQPLADWLIERPAPLVPGTNDLTDAELDGVGGLIGLMS